MKEHPLCFPGDDMPAFILLFSKPYLLQVQILPGERHLLPGSGRFPSSASEPRPVGQGARGAAQTAFQHRHRDKRGET